MAGLIAKNRFLISNLQRCSQLSARAYGGGSEQHLPGTLAQQKVDIGAREVVGYGANGEVTYIDSVMAPFPAIRLTKNGDQISLMMLDLFFTGSRRIRVKLLP